SSHICPPPKSTSFPYTTLFRSLKDTVGDGKADIRRKVFTGFRKLNVQAVMNNLIWGLDKLIESPLDRQQLATIMQGNARRLLPRDRKSTRLNSSHRTISYAVFC